jgi:hypothetical protein
VDVAWLNEGVWHTGPECAPTTVPLSEYPRFVNGEPCPVCFPRYAEADDDYYITIPIVRTGPLGAFEETVRHNPTYDATPAVHAETATRYTFAADPGLQAVYGPLLKRALEQSWTADRFAAELGVPRRPPTHRQRLARFWAAHRPVAHLGPCNHDDCGCW